MLAQILAVAAGGMLGAVARYLSVLAVTRYTPQFPMGTLLVNVAGSFLLGMLLFGLLPERWLSPQLKLFAGTGFCGAFTTMSAFALETVSLASVRGIFWALLNIVLHTGLSISAVLLARVLSGRT